MTWSPSPGLRIAAWTPGRSCRSRRGSPARCRAYARFGRERPRGTSAVARPVLRSARPRTRARLCSTYVLLPESRASQGHVPDRPEVDHFVPQLLKDAAVDPESGGQARHVLARLVHG